MKLVTAAKILEEGYKEAMTYYQFPFRDIIIRSGRALEWHLCPPLSEDAGSLRKKLIEIAGVYKDMFYTLTLDNGNEFAEHEKISKDLGIQVYFAHPYSSWERGLNENTNGLIRQFFPKGIDLNNVPVEEVLRTQNLLNGRPRKNLGFMTPYEVLCKEIDGVALVT